MNKLTLLLLFLSVICVQSEKLLKQVVILSRHNVRTPLSKDLAEFTQKSWPKWKEKSGYLTQKGVKLEGFMGKYFSEWLNKEKLLPNRCPGKEVYVYANIKQRTRASAQAFVDKAFPGCDVKVHYNDSEKMDPIFNPVIHNTTAIFKQIALEQMQSELKSLQLNDSFIEIESILDYRNSELCKKEHRCDLITDSNKITNIKPGLKPNIKGPLKIANSAIDAFIMENYEGLNNVAWGNLNDSNQWQRLMELSRGYHNIIFNTTLIAKDISEPLLKYLSEIFLNDNEQPKMMLLMGHDANMYTLLKGMSFEYYTLKNQYEITPVGGKIVFQKWFDVENKIDLLKIDYVYQSSEQMRVGKELSLDNPPEFIPLSLQNCKVNNDGYCLWDDFVKYLNNLNDV